MVIAGLIVGNYGLRDISERTERKQVAAFWGVTDDVLNTVLFVLIGLHLVLLTDWVGWSIAVSAILITLSGRLFGVMVPVAILKPHRHHHDLIWWDLVALLTWGGLRGGVSVALVLTLPAGETRDMLLSITFAIVLFSLIVQGLTMGRMFDKKSLKRMSERAREL